MEGPYRDLGAGFARLTGVEGLRRSPRRLRFVEDALVELLRNARDAGARNVYVASSLRARRYRALTVIDDGCGIPETHKRLIFEPGVTTRHLRPVRDGAAGAAHGGGLSFHHIKNAASPPRFAPPPRRPRCAWFSIPSSSPNAASNPAPGIPDPTFKPPSPNSSKPQTRPASTTPRPLASSPGS